MNKSSYHDGIPEYDIAQMFHKDIWYEVGLLSYITMTIFYVNKITFVRKQPEKNINSAFQDSEI